MHCPSQSIPEVVDSPDACVGSDEAPVDDSPTPEPVEVDGPLSADELVDPSPPTEVEEFEGVVAAPVLPSVEDTVVVSASPVASAVSSASGDWFGEKHPTRTPKDDNQRS